MSDKLTGRISLNFEDLDLSDAELQQLLGISDPDVWSSMSKAQKLLILAKKGVQATRQQLLQNSEEE